MSILTPEHRFFELLRNEHRQIEDYLKLLGASDNNKACAEWLWLNAEMLHHSKEEMILFNYMADKKAVNSGGPLCMVFIDNYILYPPLEKCRKITGNIPELEGHQQKIFDLGLTMRVPINEHRAGKEILRFTLAHWNELQINDRRANLKTYIDIQRGHIDKEENCFFYLCANLLTAEEADRLFLQW